VFVFCAFEESVDIEPWKVYMLRWNITNFNNFFGFDDNGVCSLWLKFSNLDGKRERE